MVLDSYEVRQGNNIAAALFSWLLLAGFIVFPGTFKSLNLLREDSPGGRPALAHRVPLVWFSSICCFIGLLGNFWLWLKFRHNYVWLLEHLFG